MAKKIRIKFPENFSIKTVKKMPYDNEGKFVLFNNDKGNNPKRPDYRGSFTLEGVEYELSGWKRKSNKDGTEFISGDVKVKEERRSGGGGQAPAPRREESRSPSPLPSPRNSSPQPANFDDEDVPF